jgi:hypothetical protein
MAELYRRIHDVSHFQIDLLAKGAQMTEGGAGGTLVRFSPGQINVATAWDENGTVPPLVEIIMSGFDPLTAAGIEGLIPIASGPFEAGPDGVEVGNFIMSDVNAVALAKGRYTVTVFLDKVEPMTARKVHFHFLNAA